VDNKEYFELIKTNDDLALMNGFMNSKAINDAFTQIFGDVKTTPKEELLKEIKDVGSNS